MANQEFKFTPVIETLEFFQTLKTHGSFTLQSVVTVVVMVESDFIYT